MLTRFIIASNRLDGRTNGMNFRLFVIVGTLIISKYPRTTGFGSDTRWRRKDGSYGGRSYHGIYVRELFAGFCFGDVIGARTFPNIFATFGYKLNRNLNGNDLQRRSVPFHSTTRNIRDGAGVERNVPRKDYSFRAHALCSLLDISSSASTLPRLL